MVSGATTREEVCKEIREYWKKEWSQEEGDRAIKVQSARETLIEPLARHMYGKDFKKWDEEQYKEGMIKAFKKARGACGVDGFAGEEIANLPEGVAAKFYEVTKKWRKNRRTPAIMKYILQCALPKPGKEAKVENLRLLSIFLAFWRTFEASSLKTKSFEEWKTAVGMKDVAWKESAEEMAAVIATVFDEYGFLGALDYSKAYDKMAPEVSGEAMIASGVDEDLVRTLQDVWTQQRRFVAFDGHLSKEELQTSDAHPQRGPMGCCGYAVIDDWWDCKYQ